MPACARCSGLFVRLYPLPNDPASTERAPKVCLKCYRLAAGTNPPPAASHQSNQFKKEEKS